jgi:hypothetical protein
MIGMVCLVAWLGCLTAAAEETQIVYLSGQGKDDPVSWEFYCTGGRNSGKWTTIGVPSNWELKGFGDYNYGNDKKKADEQGKYRRTFEIPAAWAGQRIFLVFDGVMTDTEVWINGNSAGPKHQGGFYRFKYEITDLVKAGENLLEVTVSKVSSDPSVEQAERQADYWVFGGIYRPVYLEAVPKQFIEWIAVDARADGACRVEAHLNGTGDADSVTAAIIGPDGTVLGEVFQTKLKAGQAKTTLGKQVRGHRTWTAEVPNLYTVRVSLWQGIRMLHAISQRFGFRTFEVRPGDGLYLNSQKIRLKGVCRHSFWPDSGRCLSKEISDADVRLIREMNMNAVRMSHYPPDEHFLDTCDEVGLYVLDELAGWQKPPYDTEIGKKLIKEMVPRDVCHPCILFWDNGNEGGWNRDLDDQFALYDPQNRTVLHPWENLNGIDTAHYRNYETTRKKLSNSLYMPTEFLHGLYDGGLGAGLDDYWKAMYASPMGAGGFLWALVDEGVVRTDRNGEIDVAGNQAPDGIVGPYRQKEASFYTIKEIWSPVHIDMPELPPDFDGTIKVENRYDFTNLCDCRFEMRLANFPAPADRQGRHTDVLRKGVQSPDIPPHERGTLRLDLPADWRNADVLYLTASGPDRKELWTWSWDIQTFDHHLRRSVVTKASDAKLIRAKVQEGRIRIEAGTLTLAFATDSADLVEVAVAGKPIAFGGGPKLLGGAAHHSRLTAREEGDTIVLDANYEGDLKHARWTVHPTGWISLEYEYELQGEFALFGISFDYPESKMRSMRFLGQGPFRVWKNRLKGGTPDVWSNNYKNDIPGVTWDFPEFKGYYRDWRWVVFSTEQGDITVVNGTPDLYLGVYRPNDGPFPANTKLNVPDTGIAFLHGIPAIGTKFDKPEVLGPQSWKNQAAGTYRGTVWFHFGN